MTLQPDFRTTARPDRARLGERLVVVVGLAALTFVGFTGWRAREEAKEARARLAATRLEVDRQSADLKALQARLQLQSDAGGLSAPTRIVAAIATVLPPEARLERLAIDYAQGTSASLELRVRTRHAAAWDRLLEGLEGSPAFGQVEPGPESRKAEVESVIRARWVGAAR